MHKSRKPPNSVTLGPRLAAARAAGVKWKDLELKYGLSRARLDQIWGAFKGRHRCACPNCGHVFDPKRPLGSKPGAASQSSTREHSHGASRTQT